MAFLPPYSPDLNPVECLWAWLKRHALANFCPAVVNRSKVETIWEVKWRLCQLWLKIAGSGSPRFFMNHRDRVRWEVK